MEIIYRLDQIDEVARKVIEAIGDKTHIAFYAEMGAGKTTLISAICALWNVTDAISSPTFAIVNEYQGDKQIFHFDFYRIKNEREALDLGLFDYFDSPAVCFMEWPECIENLLPEDCVKIYIKILENNSRCLTIDVD